MNWIKIILDITYYTPHSRSYKERQLWNSRDSKTHYHLGFLYFLGIKLLFAELLNITLPTCRSCKKFGQFSPSSLIGISVIWACNQCTYLNISYIETVEAILDQHFVVAICVQNQLPLTTILLMVWKLKKGDLNLMQFLGILPSIIEW